MIVVSRRDGMGAIGFSGTISHAKVALAMVALGLTTLTLTWRSHGNFGYQGQWARQFLGYSAIGDPLVKRFIDCRQFFGLVGHWRLTGGSFTVGHLRVFS